MYAKMFGYVWLCVHNYHSCQSASCAVILSIWSTSMSRQTSSLADIETIQTKRSIQGASSMIKMFLKIQEKKSMQILSEMTKIMVMIIGCEGL